MLPSRSEVITVKVRRNASSADVYRMVAQAAGVSPDNQDFFSLYEIVEHTFGESQHIWMSLLKAWLVSTY